MAQSRWQHFKAAATHTYTTDAIPFPVLLLWFPKLTQHQSAFSYSKFCSPALQTWLLVNQVIDSSRPGFPNFLPSKPTSLSAVGLGPDKSRKLAVCKVCYAEVTSTLCRHVACIAGCVAPRNMMHSQFVCHDPPVGCNLIFSWLWVHRYQEAALKSNMWCSVMQPMMWPYASATQKQLPHHMP